MSLASWTRARAGGWDVIVVLLGAVMLAVFAVEPGDTPTGAATRAFDWLAVLIVVAAAGLLLARRRYPLTVVMAILVLVGWWNVLGYRSGLINVVSLVAYFTVGATGDRRKQSAAVAVTLVPLVVYAVVDDEPWWWLVGALGWPLAAVLFGELSRSRRAVMDSYRRRAVRAEADREAEAERRVAQERLRIARDLHDLLGHTVSLMTVQASVAADKFDRSPERSRAAIEHIRAAGRQATSEVRATVELLRNDPDELALAPTPAISDVDALAASTARVGLEVDCTVAADAVDVDPLVGLTVYRIVQESLTNVIRHADAGQVSVRIDRRDGVVTCVVADDGTACHGRVVAGNGLRGMVERVGLAGGTIHYGARPGGGFEVAATLPARRGR
ncbi:MAG: sensor histidine kinase [Jiangellaceae bacterium]